jgi:ATP-dependent Clp protease ATP-binding subunit ClpX
MDGITFEIDEKALDFIVDKAVEYKLGARGLRSLCEEILTDAMFDMPGAEETSLKVTLKYAKDKLTKTTIKKLKAVS